jgi:hypothetical protein
MSMSAVPNRSPDGSVSPSRLLVDEPSEASRDAESDRKGREAGPGGDDPAEGSGAVGPILVTGKAGV